LSKRQRVIELHLKLNDLQKILQKTNFDIDEDDDED